jgi:hypothetical protein
MVRVCAVHHQHWDHIEAAKQRRKRERGFAGIVNGMVAPSPNGIEMPKW